MPAIVVIKSNGEVERYEDRPGWRERSSFSFRVEDGTLIIHRWIQSLARGDYIENWDDDDVAQFGVGEWAEVSEVLDDGTIQEARRPT